MNNDATQERFEVVELLGIPALFTDNRIDRATVPANPYCYDLRGSDHDPGKPVAVEAAVVVYYGALLQEI